MSTLYDEEDDELEEAEEDFDETEEESQYIDDSLSVGSEVSGEDESDASATEGAGRETIDRFKDDLFAEEEDSNGSYPSIQRTVFF